MPTTRTTKLGALCLLAAILAGCAGAERRDRANALTSTANFYMKAMRWGEYQAALGLIKAEPHDDDEPREKGDPPEAGVFDEENLARLERVRMVSVEHELTSLGEDAQRAKMLASYRYHIGASISIESATQTGTWWFDEADEAWYLDSELPSF